MWAMACQMSIHALERELGVPTASAGPWQASLGPASGASHQVWSPQWAVSRPTSTTAGPL